MKVSFKYLLLSIGAAVALSACDVIEGPKIDPSGFTGSTNKVLIEDFTGHMCGNCPQAHAKAAQLKATYGENLVVVAVHAGGFATVVPSLGYSHDFNTAMGRELEAYYHADNLGLPIGMVNRKTWNGSVLTRFADWGTEVSAVLAEQPKIKMELTSDLDDATKALEVHAKLEYFTTGDANHHVVVLITEDSIVAKQADYSTTTGHIEDYVQNHVLRTSVTTGTWGVPIKGSEIFLGEKFDLKFNTVLNDAWVPENCYVVVYVMDNLTKEILQVDEIHLH
jgi:thiol-disulfide isomerase/thioredoxin